MNRRKKIIILEDHWRNEEILIKVFEGGERNGYLMYEIMT